MPGGAACTLAAPPPCPVWHADRASAASAHRTNPPSFAMRSSIGDRLLQLPFARYGHVRMSEELSGQVAIVTGGASGIGAATAALLAEAGAAVIVADLNAAKDGVGRFVQHDVTNEESWQALLADVLKREGRLDIVVNNAGISGGAGSVEKPAGATWE